MTEETLNETIARLEKQYANEGIASFDTTIGVIRKMVEREKILRGALERIEREDCSPLFSVDFATEGVERKAGLVPREIAKQALSATD